MAKTLTKRQLSILGFIIESIRDHGCPPTIAEIGAAFSISSTNGVNDHLIALEKKGYIRRTSKARGIHVTEKAAAGLYKSDVSLIPLVGRVAAGSPILAEENIESHVAVSGSLAKSGTFCLRVQGDSMIEDGILERDIVIVDPERPVQPGDTVVAWVDDEVTIKRYYPKSSQIELRPANATMKSMVVSAQRVRIQGVVVALQRLLK